MAHRFPPRLRRPTYCIITAEAPGRQINDESAATTRDSPRDSTKVAAVPSFPHSVHPTFGWWHESGDAVLYRTRGLDTAKGGRGRPARRRAPKKFGPHWTGEPWEPVNWIWSQQLFPARLLQPLDQLAHFLRAASVGDQERVGGVDDDQILHAQQRHQFFLGVHVIPGARFNQCVGKARVPVSIALLKFVHRVPASHIIPADIAGGKADDIRGP